MHVKPLLALLALLLEIPKEFSLPSAAVFILVERDREEALVKKVEREAEKAGEGSRGSEGEGGRVSDEDISISRFRLGFSLPFSFLGIFLFLFCVAVEKR